MANYTKPPENVVELINTISKYTTKDPYVVLEELSDIALRRLIIDNRDLIVLQHRIPLTGFEPKSQKELGEKFNCQPANISILQNKAVRKLRKLIPEVLGNKTEKTESKINKNGENYTLEIPADMVEALEWSEGQELAVHRKEVGLVIAPARYILNLNSSGTDLDFFEKYNIEIADLELSVRANNVLRSIDVRYVGELVQKSNADLLKTRSCGRRTLKEIIDCLYEMGLSLGTKVDNWEAPGM